MCVCVSSEVLLSFSSHNDYRLVSCFALMQDLKDYLRSAGEVTYADAHKEQRNQGYVLIQGDHLSGKPGNVREFETCQGNGRDVVNSQRNVREKNLVMEKCPKTVHY